MQLSNKRDGLKVSDLLLFFVSNSRCEDRLGSG